MSNEILAATLTALPPNAATRLAALLEWARIQVDSAFDAAGVDNVVLVAQGMYSKYIAPLDVPWIPDSQEPAMIDLPAKWFIGQVIRGFHNIVHREPSP
jgi:hypothetical protein